MGCNLPGCNQRHGWPDNCIECNAKLTDSDKNLCHICVLGKNNKRHPEIVVYTGGLKERDASDRGRLLERVLVQFFGRGLIQQEREEYLVKVMERHYDVWGISREYVTLKDGVGEAAS